MEDEKKEPRESSMPKKEDQNDISKEDSESNDHSKNTEVGAISGSSIISFIDETDMDEDEQQDESVIRKLANRKKRPYRRSGKVQKRKTPSKYRRRVIRKAIVKRQTRRHQNVSIPELSPRTVKTTNIPCRYCGHRCCRRFKDTRRRLENWQQRDRGTKNRKITKKRTNAKKTVMSGQEVVSIQAGSRSAMLSPLFLGTNNELEENRLKRDQEHNCQISPEMIIVTLQKLSKWKQEVPTESILKYIKLNYPVNQEIASLEKELREKLGIATVAGFVKQISDNMWELTSALQETKLSTTHVTLFWKLYADTMSPIKLDNTNEYSETGAEREKD